MYPNRNLKRKKKTRFFLKSTYLYFFIFYFSECFLFLFGYVHRLEVLISLGLSTDEATQEYSTEAMAELLTVPAIQVRIILFWEFFKTISRIFLLLFNHYHSFRSELLAHFMSTLSMVTSRTLSVLHLTLESVPISLWSTLVIKKI